MKVKPRFLLLYGSETGNAEAISAELVDQAAARGLTAERYQLNDTDRRFNIERERCVVIVTSTTGEGDPPENAVKFVKRITKRSLPNDYLQNVNITILGLGDSNYSNFCNCAKTVWSAVMSLGAKEFYPPGWADDATGLEVVVDPWIEGLWEPLVKTLKMIEDNPDINGSGDASMNGVTGDKLPDMADHVDASVKVHDEKSKTEDENSVSGRICGSDCALCHSETLKDKDLTIPLLGPDFLQIQYNDDDFDTSKIPVLNGMHLPSSASDVAMATVAKARQLTSEDAVKTALELQLDITDLDFSYQAGDSFSVVCQNDADEINRLFERLKISDVADKHYVLNIDPNSKKRSPSVPKHIPSEATLRHTLTHCCDMRCVPKKAFLRVLVEAATNEKEKRRLQELCSKEGQQEYANYLRLPSLGLLDILDHFQSCQPKIERILEHITPLQPRPYSASSSGLATPSQLSFVFNVMKIDQSEGRTYAREGVCTGWLDKLTIDNRQTALEDKMQNLTLDTKIRLPIFKRTHNAFHLPDDTSLPVIMIGPGTGVAPFIGFLRRRQTMTSEASDDVMYGPLWLFFGCRHRNKDYLYENELTEFQKDGILTKFSVSFSRDGIENAPKYVQDCMVLEKENLIEWLDKGAHVFVCGDAKNMARQVFEKFVSLLSEVKSLSEKDARAFMMTKRLKKSYHEDVWT